MHLSIRINLIVPLLKGQKQYINKAIYRLIYVPTLLTGAGGATQ